MGPLADRRFHLLGIAESYRRRDGDSLLAQQYSILGPILALLVYITSAHPSRRWYALKPGYRRGPLADAPLAKAG